MYGEHTYKKLITSNYGATKWSHINFLLCEFFDDANDSIFEQEGYRTDYRNQMPNNDVRLLIFSSEYDAE